MFKSSISKLPVLLLARNKTLFQQTIKRNLTITPPLLKEKKKQNSPKIEKKVENKGTKFQEAKKKVYYKFLCKCGVGFNDFPKFLDHVKVSHKIENLNFAEIFASRNGSKWDIKFYWHLSCQCGHKFSSSLCSADLKVKAGEFMLNNNDLMSKENVTKIAEIGEMENEGKIEILKKYNLRCLKCKKNAKFDNENLLDEFLRDRVKQKLIYSFYKDKFAKFKTESHSERALEGHIQGLCEKCQLLGRYCGEELIQQEQITQIGYVPPFWSGKWY